ncbi:MAG TPA: hypothetical protein VJT75_07465 [Thermoleophilaceae bacterium]|nr:hypothetical protein [Thermoleophilaceae bacterium]
MRRALRSRLTFSNVVSVLALFVALGGTTYAAATIGAGDIRNDAVRSRHIDNGQVKQEDLGAGSVNSAKVANASLSGADVKANGIGGGRITDESLTGQDVFEPSLVGVNADKLDSLDSTEFPRARTVDVKLALDGDRDPVFALGSLRLRARCTAYDTTDPGLDLYAKNVGSQTGELNAGYEDWESGQVQATSYTEGYVLGAGAEASVNREVTTSAPIVSAVVPGQQEKAEGHLIFRTPGQVTTFVFHAFAFRASNMSDSFCELFGTAFSGAA